MDNTKLQRINELSRISKERELTSAERVEQQVLRKAYVEEWRASVTSVLDNTVVMDGDGNKRPLKKKGE